MIIFIPIKEVSQRVPNKNFRNLGGLPLYKKCLYKLLNHKVYIDTDSEKLIKEIESDPKLENVIAYSREKDLCGHKVSVCDLIKNFIEKFNIKSETICQLHVTSPFLKIRTIEEAVKKIKTGHDSVVSCNRYQNRLWRREAYGFCPVNHNPLKLEQTQDLPVFYEENSLFYIFNSESFLKTSVRVGVNPYFYETTYPENLDIDTEDDWKIVESIVRLEN